MSISNYYLFKRSVQLAFVCAISVGGASVGRLLRGEMDFGALGELRFLLMVPIAVGSIAVLAYLAPIRRVHLNTWALVAGMTGLHVFVLLSYCWANSPWAAPQQLTDVAALIIAVLIFWTLFEREPDVFVSMLMWVSVGIALLMLLFFALRTGAIEGEADALGAGGIGTARVFGIALIAVVYWAMFYRRLILVTLVPLLVAVMMLSGSRAALLAVFVALAVIWWHGPTITPRVNRLSFGIWLFVAAAVIAAAFFATAVGQELIQGFIISNIVVTGTEPTLYLADRDIIFRHALNTYVSAPVTGLGIGAYRGPFGEVYPHNQLLMYAVDSGILAAAGCLLAIVYFLCVGSGELRPIFVAAASIGTFSLVAAQFAGSYYDARLFWLMLAALAAGKVERRRSQADT